MKRWFVAGPPLGRRRGAGVRRGGVAHRVPRAPGRPDRTRRWQAVVVDDGSPRPRGEIAAEYAAPDPRIRVVHTANGGLGAARNVGTAHVRRRLPGVPGLRRRAAADRPGRPRRRLEASPARTSSPARCCAGRPSLDGRCTSRRGCSRLHKPARDRRPDRASIPRSWATCSPGTSSTGARSGTAAGLSWPEGMRYEDQPTTTRAYLAGRFDVLPDPVYHWRIRDDGTSITQQRGRGRRPARPLGDQADGATPRSARTATRGRAGLRRPGAAPATCGATSGCCPAAPTSGGRCCATGCWSSGASAPWSHSRTAAGAPALRLAGRAGPPRGRGRPDDVGRDSRRPGTTDGSAAGRHVDVPSEVLDLSTVDPAALALRDFELR